LTQLALGLDRERFEPGVCCLFGTGPLGRVLEAGGIQVVDMGIPGGRLRSHPWEIIGHVARVTYAIRAARPEIVHGFLYWAYVAGAFSGRLAGVPIIVASRRSLGTFKAGNTLALGVERIANRMTDTLIANSLAVKADVVRQERVPPARVQVIYNGIDWRRYAIDPHSSLLTDFGVAPKSVVVTVIANLIPYKGHTHLFEAWKEVALSVPGAVALVVGDGPVRDELEALVRYLRLEGSVRFLGRRMDIPEILAVTDVLAHPSLEEGFCNAILEAMAASKPVVATAVGGNPEAVVDGQTGLLVPPGDPAALASALICLLTDSERRRRMGMEGLARIKNAFDLRTMVDEYEQTYLRLLARKKIRPGPGGPEGNGGHRAHNSS
jgi:glycosyltransferase involved in cell wall biosynthesis